MALSIAIAPTTYPPWEGMAIHFGAHFGTTPTGNPPRSGLLLEGITVTEYPAAARVAEMMLETFKIEPPNHPVTPSATQTDKDQALLPIRAAQVISDDPPSSYQTVSSAIVRRKGNLKDLGQDTAELHDITTLAPKL